MLIHDWSCDPLVFNNPWFKEQITSSQIGALKSAKAGDDPVELVRKFLIESKIYETFNKTLAS